MRSEQFSFITGDIAATTSALLPQGWGCEGELMFCLTELAFLLSPAQLGTEGAWGSSTVQFLYSVGTNTYFLLTPPHLSVSGELSKGGRLRGGICAECEFQTEYLEG